MHFFVGGLHLDSVAWKLTCYIRALAREKCPARVVTTRQRVRVNFMGHRVWVAVKLQDVSENAWVESTSH